MEKDIISQFFNYCFPPKKAPRPYIKEAHKLKDFLKIFNQVSNKTPKRPNREKYYSSFKLIFKIREKHSDEKKGRLRISRKLYYKTADKMLANT
jgi:hypothetical protein